MNKDFPRLLTLMRKEKKLSQKDAALNLGISQALLSHYEKGIREPGLDFLCNVSKLYNVSSDYLLGLSSDRGSEISENEGTDNGTNKTSVFASMGKALTTNSISVLYDLLRDNSYKEIGAGVQKYLSLCVYKIFRYIYSSSQENSDKFFAISSEDFDLLSSSAILLSENKIKAATNNLANENIKPSTSYDELRQKFPQQSPALFNVIKNAETEIEKLKKVN